MKKIENEFIEKQKIAVDLEKKKSATAQEKALTSQSENYEKELKEKKEKIKELE